MPRPEKPPVENCLTEGCERKSQYNGICSSCYGQAKKLIDAGETTWEELEAMGMVKGKAKPFLVKFRKLKQDEKGPEVHVHLPTATNPFLEDM